MYIYIDIYHYIIYIIINQKTNKYYYGTILTTFATHKLAGCMPTTMLVAIALCQRAPTTWSGTLRPFL